MAEKLACSKPTWGHAHAPPPAAKSVFERMCASDPRVRSGLRPCGRRLVSADSSPLTVRGELEMTVVFPSLNCENVAGSLNNRIGWSAGHGGLAVVFATSAGSTNGTIVGGGTIDTTVESTETDSSRSCLSDNIGGPATGQ